MFTKRLVILKISLLLVVAIASFTYTQVRGQVPAAGEFLSEPSLKIASSPEPVTAPTVLIVDVTTGQEIFALNSQAVRPIASITKLFTAAALFESADLETVVTVTERDILSPEPFGKLKAGETYNKRDLIFPLLLESSNDAATVLERTANEDLIIKMNALAKSAGLESTYLSDASGLGDKNTSTAHDLAKWLIFLYQNQPHVLDITTLKQYVGPYTGWINNSPVLAPGYQGGKHGYTEAAGRTVVALFKENLATGDRLIAYVLLGGRDTRGDMDTLRTYVQQNVRFE